MHKKLTSSEIQFDFCFFIHFVVPHHVITVPEIVFENSTLVSMVLPIDGRKIRLDLVPNVEELIPLNLFRDGKKFNDAEPFRKSSCHYKSITANVFASVSNCDKYYVIFIANQKQIHGLAI